MPETLFSKQHINIKYTVTLQSFWFICILLKPQCLTIKNEPVHEISNNVVCATSKGSDQPAHTRSLIRAFARRLNIL